MDVPVSWTNYLGVKRSVHRHFSKCRRIFLLPQLPNTTGSRASGPTASRWTGPATTSTCATTRRASTGPISWQPVGKDLQQALYECRHGLSYSRFSCDYRDLHAEQTLFIPLEDDVELWDVKIRNTDITRREISVFSYAEFSFHHIEIDNQNLQMSLYAAGSSCEDGIIEYDFFYEPWTSPLFRRQLRAIGVRLRARQLFSAVIARRRIRWRWSKARAATARSWAGTTAPRCINACRSRRAKRRG